MTETIIVGKPTAPTGPGDVVLFDSTWGPTNNTSLARRRGYPDIQRASVAIFSNQAGTFKLQIVERDSSTWRTINNGGAGDAVAANTTFIRDSLVVYGFDDFRLVLSVTDVPNVLETTTKLTRGDRASGA